MSYLTNKKVSMTFGITFIAAGVLGFIPNPLVAADGIFAVNFMHNLVHVLTGSVFLFGALKSERIARLTTQGVCIAYVGVTILGFLMQGDMLLGLMHINDADKWLHLGLAVVILAAGFVVPGERSMNTTGA